MSEIAIVIGAHPNSDRNNEILKECLLSLEESNLTKIVVGHAMPHSFISQLCDYYLYEAANEYIHKEDLLETLTPFSAHEYVYTENPETIYRSQLNLFVAQGSHHYAAFQNMINGAKLAKSKGFTHMFFTEADNIFDTKDLEKYLELIRTNIESEKKGLFFKGHQYGLNALSVLICFLEIDFFLDSCKHIQSKNDWLATAKSSDGSVTVEKVFMTLFRDNSKLEFLEMPAGDDNLTKYFPNSKTNLINFASSSKVYPISNFCSKWNPEFDGLTHYHYLCAFHGSKVSGITSTICVEKGGGDMEFFSRHTSAGFDFSFEEIDLSPLYTEDIIIFENTYHFEDRYDETQSFTISGEQLQKYLKLNTIQFQSINFYA